MELETGKIVVYRAEICRVEGIERKSPDGIQEREYCVLVPLNSGSVRYYLPMEYSAEKVRGLLTREEVLELIHGMGGEEKWYGNLAERRQRHSEVIASGDHRRIAEMLSALYHEKQRREAQGRKLNATDERTMKFAESIINGEFGFVLGIKPEEVPGFIEGELRGSQK